jgi:hypothetical protein
MAELRILSFSFWSFAGVAREGRGIAILRRVSDAIKIIAYLLLLVLVTELSSLHLFLFLERIGRNFVSNPNCRVFAARETVYRESSRCIHTAHTRISAKRPCTVPAGEELTS